MDYRNSNYNTFSQRKNNCLNINELINDTCYWLLSYTYKRGGISSIKFFYTYFYDSKYKNIEYLFNHFSSKEKLKHRDKIFNWKNGTENGQRLGVDIFKLIILEEVTVKYPNFTENYINFILEILEMTNTYFYLIDINRLIIDIKISTFLQKVIVLIKIV